jgi:hypothetical protein
MSGSLEQQSMSASDQLAEVVAAYRETLGHPVPTEVVQMFATRPGPLILEIRQALALQRPVAGWAADYRRKQHSGHLPLGAHDVDPPPRPQRASTTAPQPDALLSSARDDTSRW